MVLEAPTFEKEVDIQREMDAPVQMVECANPSRRTRTMLRENHRDLVFMDVLHDGNVIPHGFLVDKHGRTIRRNQFFSTYVQERDWGASMMARKLAWKLGIAGYYRVNVARVLMDYGRFPGSTPAGAEHLERFAINYPFSNLLSPVQKRRLLNEYYDGISDTMESAIEGRRLKLSIHTYDRLSTTGRVRPKMSVITRARGVEEDYQAAAEVFDDLYPQELGEFTADPVLRDRILLTLQKKRIFVEPNYPYSLPEGSLEVRSQVWSFFTELRRQFQETFPGTVEQPEYELVWKMLLDTNLRSVECEALRSFLHRFQRPPAGEDALYERARQAYVAVGTFMKAADGRFLRSYRNSPRRLNSIGIEVRKDLLWEFDDDGAPMQPLEHQADQIAGALAEAIMTWLEKDRTTPW